MKSFFRLLRILTSSLKSKAEFPSALEGQERRDRLSSTGLKVWTVIFLFSSFKGTFLSQLWPVIGNVTKYFNYFILNISKFHFEGVSFFFLIIKYNKYLARCLGHFYVMRKNAFPIFKKSRCVGFLFWLLWLLLFGLVSFKRKKNNTLTFENWPEFRTPLSWYCCLSSSYLQPHGFAFFFY